VTAPAFAQQNNSVVGSASNTQALAFSSNVTLGSLRLCVLRPATNSDVVSTVVGSASGAYTRLGTINNAALSLRSFLYYKEGGAAGAENVTITTTTTGNTSRIALAEYTGVLSSASLDGTALAQRFTSGTTISTGIVTTTAADSLLVAILLADADATTVVPASSETERLESGARLQLQDKGAAIAGDYTSSWTLGVAQAGVYFFAAFKSDTASPASPGWNQYQHRRTTLITL
jgi:hypothetical protein